jgi:hypothetical protein
MIKRSRRRLLDEGVGVVMTRHGLHIALVALAAVSTGAVSCGGGGSSSCAANVAAEWIVTENGVVVACLPGDEVDINVDSMTATFPCSDGTGITPDLAGGLNHAVSLTLFDASGNSLSQTPTNSVFVPCGSVTDIGQVQFSLTP